MLHSVYYGKQYRRFVCIRYIYILVHKSIIGIRGERKQTFPCYFLVPSTFPYFKQGIREEGNLMLSSGFIWFHANSVSMLRIVNKLSPTSTDH